MSEYKQSSIIPTDSSSSHYPSSETPIFSSYYDPPSPSSHVSSNKASSEVHQPQKDSTRPNIIKCTARKSTGSRQCVPVDRLMRIKQSVLLDFKKEIKFLKVERDELKEDVNDLEETVKDLKDENSTLRNDKVLLNLKLEEKDEEIRSLKGDLLSALTKLIVSTDESKTHKERIHNLVLEMKSVNNRLESNNDEFINDITERYEFPILHAEDLKSWDEW